MVFAEILHTLLFCIAIFLQLDTIGVWSEKCRHQPTSQPITTRHKICEFFEKHKAICITTGILCLPLGIAYAITYGVAKALDKYQKHISNRQPEVQQRKTFLQMKLKYPVVDLLTDQNLMNYANTDDGTQRKTAADKCTSPESPSSRNQIAFTCCMLRNDQLKTIINDENLPQTYRDIAYCIGTMRKMLEPCQSEKLLEALKNNQLQTYESIVNIKNDSDTDCHDEFLPTHKPPLASKDELIYYCKEFWSEYNAFNRALLQQTIVYELETSHTDFYNAQKRNTNKAAKERNIDEAVKATIAMFITSLH